MDFIFKLTDKDREQFQELFREVIKKELEGIIKVKEEKISLDDLLTLDQACKMIGCSKTTLYHYRKKGLINYSQVGRKIRIKRSDLFNSQEIKRRVR